MERNELEKQMFHDTDILIGLKTYISVDENQKIEIHLSADESPNNRPPRISMKHLKLVKSGNEEEWQKVGHGFSQRLTTVSLGNVLSKMSDWFKEVKETSKVDIQYLPHISNLINEGINLGLIVRYEDVNQGTYFVLPEKQPRIVS